MVNEILQKDDKVRFIRIDGYSHVVREGEIGKVLIYYPPVRDITSSSGFVWPAYVKVQTEKGVILHCHASRVTKEGVQQ